jgi:hypothetical protein
MEPMEPMGGWCPVGMRAGWERVGRTDGIGSGGRPRGANDGIFGGAEHKA